MTVPDLLQQINQAGGTVWLTLDRQLHVKRVPKHLVPELKRMKSAVIRHIEGDNYRLLVKTFNLKRISREKLKQIENGQNWRIADTQSDFTWKGSRYRHG